MTSLSSTGPQVKYLRVRQLINSRDQLLPSDPWHTGFRHILYRAQFLESFFYLYGYELWFYIVPLVLIVDLDYIYSCNVSYGGRNML